jgi:hypothetical protein
MKKTLFPCLFLFLIPFVGFGWGQTGHRVVAQIANWHLSQNTKKEIERVLGSETMAVASNWMDEIKSDKVTYGDYDTWHYLTVVEGEGYQASIQEPSGDAYGKTKMLIDLLKKGGLEAEEEKRYLKMLIHLVGDLHQPLHVGKGDDKGGNEVNVNFFNSSTNLHTVWDSKIIDHKQYSFTELSHYLNQRVNERMITEVQSAPMEDWLEEAVGLRKVIYDLPDHNRLSYEYVYYAYPHIENQLLKGGLRLAGILNEIYG